MLNVVFENLPEIILEKYPSSNFMIFIDELKKTIKYTEIIPNTICIFFFFFT